MKTIRFMNKLSKDKILKSLNFSSLRSNHLFKSQTFFFSAKEIQEVPNHKCPISEDTVPGRYSETLFIAASREKNLYHVYNDMVYLSQLYDASESFRTLADNAGLNTNQLNSFSNDLSQAGEFCETTIKFLDLIARNKRFMYVNEISKKFQKAYSLLTKEEKITIISAQELDSNQRELVERALNANPENEGKVFKIDYHVNETVLGGLQMYTENKFMDMSLTSRVDRLREEVNKLV